MQENLQDADVFSWVGAAIARHKVVRKGSRKRLEGLRIGIEE